MFSFAYPVPQKGPPCLPKETLQIFVGQTGKLEK